MSSPDKPYPPGFENAFRGVSAVESPFSKSALKEVLFDMPRIGSWSLTGYDCDIRKIGDQGEDTTTTFYVPEPFSFEWTPTSETILRSGSNKKEFFEILNIDDFVTFSGGPDLQAGDRIVYAFGHSQHELFSESDLRDLNRKYGVLFRVEKVYQLK